MLRAAGLVHPRLGRELAHGQHGTSEPLAFVGLNVREQRGERRRFGKPHLSWSLVALIPRPVKADRTKIVDGVEVRSTTKTTSALYQLDDARDTWILSNVPRQFSGGTVHSRAGSRYSRWSAEGAEQRKTWYTHTATEIFVADHDGDPQRYAVAAARLCDHALSWEGRTRYPAPIHLAIQMDKDHPEYRKTVDAADEIDLDAEPDPSET